MLQVPAGLPHHIQPLSLAEEADSHSQPEWQAGSSGSYVENSWEEQLLEQQDHLEKEMEEAKKMISGLQVRDFSSQRVFSSRVTQPCISLAEPSCLAHSPHNSLFVGPFPQFPSLPLSLVWPGDTEPLHPYGEGTELSQEHPFLFVLGTTVPWNCKYLCGSKQSRDCVRSTGSWAGTFPGGQWAGHKRVTRKKKMKKKNSLVQW